MLKEKGLKNQLQSWNEQRIKAIALQVATGRAEQAAQRAILRKRICINQKEAK